jgi:hypothetical protein
MLAARNADVAEVLEIMRSPTDPHFADLYKVWETIRHAGGLGTAMQSAGISNNAMTRFTRSANHQAASGDKARHARLGEAPPDKPMPINEARATMGNLVNAWMDSL